MTQTYELIQGNTAVCQGDEYLVREKIEELLEAKTGIFVSLQENTDDGFSFYLHSEAADDMTDTEWNTLTATYGISHDEDAAETAISRLLGIRIQ